MAKKDDNQDTRHNRHEFGDEGPDFDPNDPSQMPDGSPSCVASNQTSSSPLFGDPYSAYTDSNW